MNTIQLLCPFKPGDVVTYRPTPHGLLADAMADREGKLIPGKSYRVMDVQKGLYVLVEEYHNPGGGIYWTEFAVAR